MMTIFYIIVMLFSLLWLVADITSPFGLEVLIKVSSVYAMGISILKLLILYGAMTNIFA